MQEIVRTFTAIINQGLCGFDALMAWLVNDGVLNDVVMMWRLVMWR